MRTWERREEEDGSMCVGEDEVLNTDTVCSHEGDQRADLVLEVSLKCFKVALLCKRKNV